MDIRQIRISLIGPSGSGKTTSAWLIQRAVRDTAVLSVAQPLRDLEVHAYKLLGLPPPVASGSQDGEMLQQFRSILLQRNKDALTTAFTRAVALHTDRRLLVNDDCRAGSKACLDALGFTYVWVQGRKRTRSDTSAARALGSPHDAVIPEQACSYTLRNDGSLADLCEAVAGLLAEIEVVLP